jgi:hypothetical protein
MSIERLLAIEEIKVLKARYFWALDRKAWDLFGSLFTDDAVFDLGSAGLDQDAASGSAVPTELVGPASIQGAAAELFRTAVTVHHGHAPQIEITGPDDAKGIWAMSDWVDFGDRSFRGAGHYDEDYRRVDGGWLISRTRLTRLRLDWS